MSAEIQLISDEVYALEVQQALREGANWSEFAQCRVDDPEVFAGRDKGEHAKSYNLRVNIARQACQSCFVLDKCLEDTLVLGDFTAFRANMTPKQLSLYASLRILHGVPADEAEQLAS